jgi:hypothetical protein
MIDDPRPQSAPRRPGVHRRVGLRVAVLSVAAALGACGGSTSRPSCPPPPAPPTSRAQSGQLVASEDRPRLAAGGSVTFTLVATGPVQYTASCDAPLQLLVTDATQLRVYAGSSAPGTPAAPGTAGTCDQVTLDPGRKLTYTVEWRTDASLPPGRYTATLLLGDQPQIDLPVVIAPGIPGAC